MTILLALTPRPRGPLAALAATVVAVDCAAAVAGPPPPVVPGDAPAPPTEETGGADGTAPPADGVDAAMDVVVTSPLPDRSDDETWCRLGTKRAAMSTPARKPLTIPKKAPPLRPVEVAGGLTGRAGRTAPGRASTCSRWSTGACAGCR